jgi:hypothetical protein
MSGFSRFLCLSFFAAAKKVSAAPHRGNANKPQTNQEKAPPQEHKHRTQARQQSNKSPPPNTTAKGKKPLNAP